MKNWSIWQWGLMGALSAVLVVGMGYGVWQMVKVKPQVAQVILDECDPGQTEERSCKSGSCSGVQTRKCNSNDGTWGNWGGCSCSGGGSGDRENEPMNTGTSGYTGIRQCRTNADCVGAGSGAICDARGKCMDPGGPEGCGYSDENRCSNPVREPGGESYCDEQGRKCSTVRVECLAPDGRTHCFIKNETQCGAPDSCGTTQKTPRPSQSVIPSPSPQIVLACIGITKSIVEPTVGETVQLTCSGSVTPAGATSLSYQFRYRINQGSWQTLLSSGAKADLKIDACGTYAVQCRTCGVVAGATQCSPVWVGAN